MSEPVVVPTDDAPPPVDDRTRWRRACGMAAIAYLLSRVAIVAGAAGVSTAQLKSEQLLTDPSQPLKATAFKGILDVLNSWDGQWYYEVIRTGYPRHVPPGVTFGIKEARAAFFPLFPMTVRYLDKVLPGGDVFAALGMNFVLGFLAVLLVGLLARRLFDIEIAERSMVLMALFPGSFVLSFAYTEALMFVLVAVCLWCLLDERWILAGLTAALVTASRPNGVAICFACAVAALIAIKQKRDWLSLVAPALSPLGWLTFQLMLSRHADEKWVWFRVQREAWDEGISFGLTVFKGIAKAITNPFASPASWLTLTSVAAMAVMVYASLKVKLPKPVLAYCFVVLALMLLPSTVTARPRFLYTAFPLLIGVAAWWPAKWRTTWQWLMVACGAGLVILPVLYGGFAAIP